MKGTPLTDDSYEYIVEHFATDERALLAKMWAPAEAAGVPHIMISDEQARFVAFFIRAIKAKRVLDVGTLFGFSAAIMSRAVGSDGEVISLEFSDLHADVAEANLKAVGATNVRVLRGPALDQMQKLDADSFDFILIDADKPNYLHYLKEALRLVRSAGVIAGDNALSWGKIAQKDLPESDPDYLSVISVREFNDAFARNKAIFGCIVPIGDGMAMGVVEK